MVGVQVVPVGDVITDGVRTSKATNCDPSHRAGAFGKSGVLVLAETLNVIALSVDTE